MALSANPGSKTSAKFGAIQAYKVGATKIWQFAIVAIRLTDGLLYPAAEDIADANKQLVIGWAEEASDDTGKRTYVRVRADGKLKLNFPGVTQTDVGKLALVKDDETVHTYDGIAGSIVVGRISEIAVEGLQVFVDFTDRPLRVATSAYH